MRVLLPFHNKTERMNCMDMLKWNRRKKRVVTSKKPDVLGNFRKIVVWYDDLSKAKKPPAWMKELLYNQDAA